LLFLSLCTKIKQRKDKIMSYEVLQEKDNVVIVKVKENIYAIDKASFEAIKSVLTPDNAAVILSTFVSAKASTAKLYDAEKAKKEEERAAKEAALAAFEKDLATWLWSTQVKTLASRVVELRQEQEAIEEVPYSIDLAGYDRIAPSKSCQRGEYRFTMFKGIPSLVVGLPDPLPRQMMLQGDIAVALHAFRVEAANEVAIPEVLKGENASKDFDVDDEGNITFNVKIKVKGNTGNRTRGPWLYTGTEFPDLDGKVFKTVAAFAIAAGLSTEDDKYPHAPAKKFRESGALTKVEG